MTRRALVLALTACLLASGQGLAAAGTAPASTASTVPTGRRAQAERQAEIKEELKTLRDEVSEASEEEAALLQGLDEVQDRQRVLDKRVGEVDGLVDAARVEAAAAEAALEAVQSEFVRAQTQLALEKEALAAEHQKLRERAVAAYIANPSSHAAELLLQARSLRDIAASAGYLETVVDLQQQAVQRFAERRDRTERLRASVEVQKDAALAQRNVVVNRLADLEAKLREQQAVRDELAAQEVRHAQLLEEVRRRKDAFEAQIEALKAESALVSALLQGLQVGAVTAVATGLLLPPVAGAFLTSPFGPRVHPIFGTVRMHDGVDYGAGMGTPIRAAAAGTVVAAGARGGYGNATIIDHGNGLATLYAHQSDVFVLPGAVVAAGQVIGSVGSTGFSTGPHLHFEVRVKGVPVDPLPYLPLAVR